MFERNGEKLGSVQVDPSSADPQKRPPRKVVAKEPEPETRPKVVVQAEPSADLTETEQEADRNAAEAPEPEPPPAPQPSPEPAKRAAPTKSAFKSALNKPKG